MPKSKHKTRRYQLSRRLTPSHGKIVSALIIFATKEGNYDRRRKETARFRNSNPIDFGFSIRQISKYHSDAIKIAIITSMTPDRKHLKVVRIKNTVERSEIERFPRRTNYSSKQNNKLERGKLISNHGAM